MAYTPKISNKKCSKKHIIKKVTDEKILKRTNFLFLFFVIMLAINRIIPLQIIYS